MPKQHLPAAQRIAVDGLLTRRALTDAQLNPHLGSRVIRERGGLLMAPATYLLATAAADDQLIAAAREHAGDDLVVTGLMACRLLGITDAHDDGAVDVLVPDGRRRVSTAYVRVHPTVRPPRTWRHCSGALVAGPHRAVVDAARRLDSLQDVRALVLSALRLRWCGLDELRAELAQHPRNGTAHLRRALRDWERGAWSAPEAEVADVAAADGRLPRFLLNATLLVGGVRVGMPDGWFVGLGLGWEVDSRLFHSDDDGFDRTLARHDAFGAHGLQLLHVTPRRARQLGARYADLLAAAVEARRTAAQPEPPGLQIRPFDPRGHVVRDLCSPPPVIDRSSGPVRWVVPD